MAGTGNAITKAEIYMPSFPISSGAPCALASLFRSILHFLEMLVYCLVTLSYKPVQTTSLHIRKSMFVQRHAVRSQSQSPNRTTPLGISFSALIMINDEDDCSKVPSHYSPINYVINFYAAKKKLMLCVWALIYQVTSNIWSWSRFLHYLKWNSQVSLTCWFLAILRLVAIVNCFLNTPSFDPEHSVCCKDTINWMEKLSFYFSHIHMET